MSYDSQERLVCNKMRRVARLPRPAKSDGGVQFRAADSVEFGGSEVPQAAPALERPSPTRDANSVDYQVRDARLTDIDRVSELIQRADPSWTDEHVSRAADLLRQLLYMPSASVMVALDGRQLDGVAILSLRPSVAARGLVGTIDLVAIEPGQELSGSVEALLKETIRSARNKGCVAIETAPPAEPAVLAALEQLGFVPAPGRISLALTSARVAVS